jgi:hypothetical protein
MKDEPIIFLDIDGVVNCKRTPNPRRLPYPALLERLRPRRDEILAWLGAHPAVTRFIVIDDEDNELDPLPLFQPSAATGLTAEIVRGAVAYLAAKTDRDMPHNGLGAPGAQHAFDHPRASRLIGSGLVAAVLASDRPPTPQLRHAD